MGNLTPCIKSYFSGKSRLQALVQWGWKRTLRLEVGRPKELGGVSSTDELEMTTASLFKYLSQFSACQGKHPTERQFLLSQGSSTQNAANK